MKKIFLLILLFPFVVFAQRITLSEIKEIQDKSSDFLISIDSSSVDAQYLGKMQVESLPNTAVDLLFAQIFKKAKSIGANAYILEKTQNLDNQTVFNKENFNLRLLYLPKKISPSNDVLFLFTDEAKKIRIDGEKINLPARSYLKINLQEKPVKIAPSGFLSTSLFFQKRNIASTSYFSITGASLGADSSQSGTLSFKTGDFTRLSESFGMFLKEMYSFYQLPEKK